MMYCVIICYLAGKSFLRETHGMVLRAKILQFIWYCSTSQCQKAAITFNGLVIMWQIWFWSHDVVVSKKKLHWKTIANSQENPWNGSFFENASLLKWGIHHKRFFLRFDIFFKATVL